MFVEEVLVLVVTAKKAWYRWFPASFWLSWMVCWVLGPAGFVSQVRVWRFLVGVLTT